MTSLMLYIFFLGIELCFAGFIFYLALSFITGAPFVPSPPTRAKAMVDLAHLAPGDIVFDLGSGDGRLLFFAAAKGVIAHGIEINPYLVFFTRIRAYFSRYNEYVYVHLGDLWKQDISRANVVFVYLLPWRMNELAQKLKRELKPGSRVVTNSFIFPNWNIEESDKKNHIYVFKVPKAHG